MYLTRTLCQTNLYINLAIEVSLTRHKRNGWRDALVPIHFTLSFDVKGEARQLLRILLARQIAEW